MAMFTALQSTGKHTYKGDEAMSKLTIVAHRGFDLVEVYSNNPPQRKLTGGDFVAKDNGQILHITNDGQRIRFGGSWWANWDEFVSQNTWVQDAIEAKRLADAQKAKAEYEAMQDEMWAEFQDMQQTMDDMRMQW